MTDKEIIKELIKIVSFYAAASIGKRARRLEALALMAAEQLLHEKKDEVK